MKRPCKLSALLITCASLSLFSLQALAATTAVTFINNVKLSTSTSSGTLSATSAAGSTTATTSSSTTVTLSIAITPSGSTVKTVLGPLAYLKGASYTFNQGVAYTILYTRTNGASKTCKSIAPVGGPSSVTVNVGSLASTAPCPSI